MQTTSIPRYTYSSEVIKRQRARVGLVVVILLLLGTETVGAQTTVPTQAETTVRVVDYGTSRVRRTCPDRKQPPSGRPSVLQATQYVACSIEERPAFNDAVRFIDVLSLEIGRKTRKVTTEDIGRWPNIDQTKPVFILRGSMVLHSCQNVNGSKTYQAGSNCTRNDVPKATGTCWQDVFGDWQCFLVGRSAKETRKQPAPQ
jgi:hypothetical protein